MNNYTLQERTKIIETFITQQINQDKPVKRWLSKLSRDGYKNWDFKHMIEAIKHSDNSFITDITEDDITKQLIVKISKGLDNLDKHLQDKEINQIEF